MEDMGFQNEKISRGPCTMGKNKPTPLFKIIVMKFQNLSTKKRFHIKKKNQGHLIKNHNGIRILSNNNGS